MLEEDSWERDMALGCCFHGRRRGESSLLPPGSGIGPEDTGGPGRGSGWSVVISVCFSVSWVAQRTLWTVNSFPVPYS